MAVTVYTKPACVQCNATYKALDKQGIEYEVVDITAISEGYKRSSSSALLVFQTLHLVSDIWLHH